MNSSVPLLLVRCINLLIAVLLAACIFFDARSNDSNVGDLSSWKGDEYWDFRARSLAHAFVLNMVYTASVALKVLNYKTNRYEIFFLPSNIRTTTSHNTTTTHNLYVNSALSTRGNHVQHSSQDSRSTKTRLHALQRFDCCVCSLLLLPQSFVWDVRLKTTSLVRQKTMLHLRTTGPPRCVHVASKLRV